MLFPLTVLSVALVLIGSVRHRVTTPQPVMRRMRWYWPALVAGWESLGASQWALTCTFPNAGRNIYAEMTAAGAVSLLAVLYAVAAGMLAERVAGRAGRGLPWPVLAGLLGVIGNWLLLVYSLL